MTPEQLLTALNAAAMPGTYIDVSDNADAIFDGHFDLNVAAAKLTAEHA